MNFSTVDKCEECITFMQDSDEPRQRNRTRILSLFNGDPPFSEEEARDQHVEINYALGSAPDVMAAARSQWEQAMTGKDRYFTVRLDRGPANKRLEWSNEITRKLAKITKQSSRYAAEYTDTVNSEGAQVMLYGVGPSSWQDKDCWYPYSVAMEDLKIPSRTQTSLCNLAYFAIMRRYTPNQLYRAAFGKYKDERWNKGVVKYVLSRLKDENVQQTDWDSYHFPERLEEDFKSNGGYWGSDAVPTINCWDFYFQEDEEEGRRWHRRVLLDYDQPTLGGGEVQHKFLYQDTEPYAEDLSHILHICFANGAHKAPFLYHSVRGLGYRLYGPEKINQRINIRFAETVLQDMMWIFSNVPAEDRERLEMIFLHHMGVLPEGVKWVPANERHQPNLDLILAGMNQNRQIMSEASSNYIQDMVGKSDRETATKTMARMSQANQMVGAFLTKAYDQQKLQYREICRRFCREGSLDPDVKEFQKKMEELGIPKEVLDVECWDVQPERTIGNGNQMLGSAMVDRLMMVFPRYDPEAQRKVLHLYSDVNTADSALAEELVPLKEVDPSPAVVRATGNFGTLMEDVPVANPRNINDPEYCQTLLALMEIKIRGVEKQGGMTDMRTITGLANVGHEIAQHLQHLAQDRGQKNLVKMIRDKLGKLMNMVKAYYQRLTEQMKKRGQQGDPAVQAKIQAIMLTANTQAHIKEAANQQKMRHKELGFVMEQRRRDMEAGVDARRSMMEAEVGAAAEDIKTAAEIRNERIRSLAALRDGEEDGDTDQAE